jgi:hypothetical protein
MTSQLVRSQNTIRVPDQIPRATKAGDRGAIGELASLTIYFSYSIKHSKVQAMSPAETTGRSR